MDAQQSTPENQHTPGPWRIDSGPCAAPDNLDIIVTASNGLRTVALVHNHADTDPDGPATCRANARLIRSAPILLEALKDLLVSIDCRERRELDESCERAREAIAKAEDRT